MNNKWDNCFLISLVLIANCAFWAIVLFGAIFAYIMVSLLNL